MLLHVNAVTHISRLHFHSSHSSVNRKVAKQHVLKAAQVRVGVMLCLLVRSGQVLVAAVCYLRILPTIIVIIVVFL